MHPQVEGLHYSAYPRPDEFPVERFVRKVQDPSATSTTGLATSIVEAVADLGMVYQSDAFGTTLAPLFGLARLFDPDAATWDSRGCLSPAACVLPGLTTPRSQNES